MKKIFKLFLFLLLLSSQSFALNYELSDFMDKKNSSLNLGYTSLDGNSYFKTGLSPNFKYLDFELGLDLNLYLPLGDYGTPKGVNNVALRYVAYNYKEKHGLNGEDCVI